MSRPRFIDLLRAPPSYRGEYGRREGGTCTLCLELIPRVRGRVAAAWYADTAGAQWVICDRCQAILFRYDATPRS